MLGYTLGAGAHVDVVADDAIGAEPLQRIQAAADAAAERIERDFARQFSHRPTVYVFASAETFRKRLVDLWRYPEASAEEASGFPAIALRDWTVAMNWAVLSSFDELTALDHELAHTMIAEYDPEGRRVPAWLNEGLARLQELSVSGTEWRSAEIRFTAASMAHTGTLFPFERLIGPAFLPNVSTPTQPAAYSQSAAAVRFVIDEVGRDGLIRILEMIEAGASFQVAYLTVSRKQVYDLESTFPERARSLATSPGIGVGQGGPVDAGPTLFVYGLPPSVPVSLALRAGSLWESSGTATPHGVYIVSLQKLPPGQYAAVASAGSVTVRATVNVAR